jgi:hypothetical protein
MPLSRCAGIPLSACRQPSQGSGAVERSQTPPHAIRVTGYELAGPSRVQQGTGVPLSVMTVSVMTQQGTGKPGLMVRSLNHARADLFGPPSLPHKA